MRRHHGDEGTIMVDALVAVIIVSLMAAVCVATLQISRRAMTRAKQDRVARLTLQTLMEATPHRPGSHNGSLNGLRYAVVVSETKTAGARLCQLHVDVTGAKRTYRLDGTRWCDRELAPSP